MLPNGIRVPGPVHVTGTGVAGGTAGCHPDGGGVLFGGRQGVDRPIFQGLDLNLGQGGTRDGGVLDPGGQRGVELHDVGGDLGTRGEAQQVLKVLDVLDGQPEVNKGKSGETLLQI